MVSERGRQRDRPKDVGAVGLKGNWKCYEYYCGCTRVSHLLSCSHRRGIGMLHLCGLRIWEQRLTALTMFHCFLNYFCFFCAVTSLCVSPCGLYIHLVALKDFFLPAVFPLKVFMVTITSADFYFHYLSCRDLRMWKVMLNVITMATGPPPR